MRWMMERFGRWLGLALLGASAAAVAQDLRPQVVAQGLEHPWALAFLPSQRMLVTERAGRLRLVEPDGRLGPAVAGLPVRPHLFLLGAMAAFTLTVAPFAMAASLRQAAE